MKHLWKIVLGINVVGIITTIFYSTDRQRWTKSLKADVMAIGHFIVLWPYVLIGMAKQKK